MLSSFYSKFLSISKRVLGKNIFWLFLPFLVFCLISAYLLLTNNYEEGELGGKYIIIYSFFE
jgi:hypothetical protein